MAPPAVPPRPTPPAISTEIVRDYGSVAIRGSVAGIDVWLDDRKLGATEAGAALVLSNLAVGRYTVKARKPGHKDWERTVEVAANRRAEVLIDIETLGPVKIVKGDDGAEMVLVPAGEFTMGSNDMGDEKPPHRVYLDAFYIDRYETTNGLYRRFMNATRRGAPLYWSDEKWNGINHPVVAVTWHDANAYCQWAGKRLPTEAEWEKAARGTDGRRYPWGDQWDSSRANSAEIGLRRMAPVGSYPGGVSPYGAHDMAGNAYEWVADWYVNDY